MKSNKALFQPWLCLCFWTWFAPFVIAEDFTLQPLIAGAVSDGDDKPSDKPEHRPPPITLAYFIPSDRKPTAKYESKIQVLMSVVADLYESDLRAKSYRPARLWWNMTAGKPRVHVVQGSRP